MFAVIEKNITEQSGCNRFWRTPVGGKAGGGNDGENVKRVDTYRKDLQKRLMRFN